MAIEQELGDIQVRILGCLIEKEATTPDQYPLTVNALTNACNQKTNRFPVTDYQQGQVGHALRELESMNLVTQTYGARVARYQHRVLKQLDIHLADMAVLCPLMLRGAQTAAEIRTRCARINAFDDVDDVEYVLNRLMERQPPMVVRIPRGSGQKEDRYHHLLAGEPDLSALPVASSRASSKSDLEHRVTELEQTVVDLQRRMDALEG